MSIGLFFGTCLVTEAKETVESQGSLASHKLPLPPSIGPEPPSSPWKCLKKEKEDDYCILDKLESKYFESLSEKE